MFEKFMCLCAVFVLLLALSGGAQATCSSYPNTFTNGTTADATQVMANFNCAALTSGSTLQNALFTGVTSVGTAAGYAAGMDIAVAGASLVVSQASSTNYAGMRIYNNLGSAVRALEIDYSGSAYPTTLLAGGPGGESASIGTTGNYPLVLGTSNAARITITGGGSVGVGIAAPSYTLHVNGSVAGTSAYNNLSDERLKKNIIPLSNGLAILGRLEPVRFDWRSRAEREVGKEFNLPAGNQIGFIAQDLREVLPEAVSVAKGKDAIMSVAESKIVPVLVAAVKELKASNDNQAAEITVLKAQMAVLQRKLGVQTASR